MSLAQDTRGGFVLTGESTPLRLLARDLWKSRELLVILARKDFYVRYRRASFGVLWAVGIPLVQAVILAVVLSHFVRFKTTGSYPVFVFSGLVGWNFFSMAIPSATGSIVENREISSKIYCPRSLFPAMSVLANSYGFVLTVVLLILLELAVGVLPGVHTLLLIPAVLLTIVFAIALGLVLAALQVYFRDVRFLVQAALIGWFYLTPVFYPLSAVRSIRPWIRINPATGFVELFRAATVGADPGWVASVWICLLWTVTLAVIAAMLYRRFDRVFADLL